MLLGIISVIYSRYMGLSQIFKGLCDEPGGDSGWGWRSVQLTTVLVYIFMFAPIVVVVVLSFNSLAISAVSR